MGNSPQFIEAYHTLFSGTGVFYANEGYTISRDNYPNGYCLFAIDLIPGLWAQFVGHWSLVKNETMRIEVQFEKILTKTINCILYAEFDNVLEIDVARQVIVDFNS